MLPKVFMATGVVVALVVGLKLLTALLGMVIGFVSFLLFTVVPIALITWLVVKLVKSVKRRPAYQPPVD
ncbi:MAG: hypothetical protein ACRELD_10485 [Longimicrobiales bacterium]